jgi:FkbM family methyltransferase
MTDNPSLIFDLNEETFSPFPCFEGIIPQGYWGNWLGVLTRANVWAFSKEVMDIYNQTRRERFEYPINDEHILDWYPLLQSVIRAKGKFTMAAIGCGWGRWLSAGAFAAKYLQKDYFLIGVEAEPEHFEWLQTHLNENKINADKYRLIRAAAADYCGNCWFYVGKSSSWYGQSMVHDTSVVAPLKESVKIGSTMPYNNETIQRMTCVDLKDVVKNQDLINYIMLDIQGEEELFLTKSPEILQKHVKMVNIGTHSNAIETNLRKFFIELGWTCTFDIPLNSEVQFNIKKGHLIDNPLKTKVILFGDGVQVWINNNI